MVSTCHSQQQAFLQRADWCNHVICHHFPTIGNEHGREVTILLLLPGVLPYLEVCKLFIYLGTKGRPDLIQQGVDWVLEGSLQCCYGFVCGFHVPSACQQVTKQSRFSKSTADA